jgi:hypothetical protein
MSTESDLQKQLDEATEALRPFAEAWQQYVAEGMPGIFHMWLDRSCWGYETEEENYQYAAQVLADKS